MKYEQKLRALVISLAGLLIIYGAGEYFAPERRLKRAESGSLMKAKPEAAALIELSGSGESLKIERKSSTWTLAEEGGASLPVLDSRVKTFLETLGDVRSLRPVSSSKEALDGLGLGAGAGRRVLVKDASGAVLADFRSGSRGPTGSELYIAKGEGAEAYAVPASLASFLSSPRTSWLDKRLSPAPLEHGAVQNIVISADIELESGKPKRALSYSLDRKDGGWASGGKDLDAVAVEALLRGILNLEAENLGSSGPQATGAKPLARIELRLGSGLSRFVDVAAPASEGRFWARASDGGTGASSQASPSASNPAAGQIWYEVSSYTLRNVLKPLEDLVKKE